MSRHVPRHPRHLDPGFLYELGEDANVRLEPGYNQDEIFDDQFERRSREIQRTPSASNAVNVIPSKQGPWSGNNQLGIERAFAPDADNRQTILKLDEWGFPEMWTLCLGLNDFSHIQDPFPIAFEVTALLEFGSGGVVQQVEVDWLNGTCITLPMNALNVVASYSQGTGEGTTSIPADLRLRATLVRGRSHFARPTRTVRFVQGQTSCRIPPFAKNAFMAPNLSLPGLTPFSFYSSGNYAELSALENGASVISAPFLTSQFVSSIDVTHSLVGSPQTVPIPPFARFLNTRNAAGAYADIRPAFAQFEIGI